MSKKRRVYVPEITGEYATEDQILSRTREYFLIMVQAHTPKPLVALRNGVFPKYRAAFDAQEEQRKSSGEITTLAARAFIDAVLGDETESLTLLTEFKHAQEATHGLYEASKALIDWSRTFNLRGKQTKIDPDADPRTVMSARTDSVWPLLDYRSFDIYTITTFPCENGLCHSRRSGRTSELPQMRSGSGRT